MHTQAHESIDWSNVQSSESIFRYLDIWIFFPSETIKNNTEFGSCIKKKTIYIHRSLQDQEKKLRK